ncbi:hypothetical protein [Deinococcus piscis]|uniref:hypothetical protein n=1 Tax=Deinococcus piscis TaxID=394230 RepID=UPI0016766166|nr:hypothetical protein [Deinococcus piscis]
MNTSPWSETSNVDKDPAPEIVDILWMDDQEAHLLLPDGSEAVWPIGALIGQLKGVEQLSLKVTGGDLELIPIQPALVSA